MIIVIIIISSSISISISFAVLLSCLYLTPWVSHFGHFSSPSRWGRNEGVSEQLPSA